MSKKLHNSGATEVVYDLAGHVLGGGESVEVEHTDARIRALLKSKVLIALKDTEETPDKNGDKK